MEIQFCTPSFFFNISQRFAFQVFDFREDQSAYLKNSLPVEKKAQLLFKNRKRNFNFFLPFQSTDKFSVYLHEKVRQLGQHTKDKHTVGLQQLGEWCEAYEQLHSRPMKRQVRSQTVKQQKEENVQFQSQPQLDVATTPGRRKVIEYDERKENQIILTKRGSSAPRRINTEHKKPMVANIDIFSMVIAVVNQFATEKFQSIFVFLEPAEIILQNYSFLNYANQRNKHFLDKTFPNEIIDKKLYLGGAEHARDVEMIQDQLKITHIVNATVEVANYCDKVEYLNIRIHDEPQVMISDHFDIVYEFIDKAYEQQDGKIFVHCAWGKSRSACFVTMYLMRKFNWTFDYAYDLVREKREIVCINDGFLIQLNV